MVTVFVLGLGYYVVTEGSAHPGKKRLYKNLRMSSKASRGLFYMLFSVEPEWAQFGYSIESRDSGRFKVVRKW
jgi:hypothetical protein